MNNPNIISSDVMSSQDNVSASIAEPEIPLRYSITELFLISCCVVLGAASVLSIEREEIVISAIALIIVLALLIAFNRRLLENYKHFSKKQDNQKKAELYSCLFGDAIADESINVMRSRAIQYSQELIDDYKATRRNSRNVYYIFQISTIILSGVTPILVLLDKVDISVPWIKWLPVIFPAIASIVTSLATSFPFQENWMTANTVVELLEAEQEKFILGVTPAYRFFDLPDNIERKRKVQESVEGFINQVNKIHLKQVQTTSEPEIVASKDASADGATA